jgi:dimethylargininase
LGHISSNTNSMVAPLRRVLVCSPRAAGWASADGTWRGLGFLHTPIIDVAQAQHDELCRELADAGAEVVHLPPSSALTLDGVYTHDASLATDHGLIILNPGKANRVLEAQAHRAQFEKLGLPILGEIQPPGSVEGGDVLWLDSKALLIGHGYRTNAAGIAQMRDLLRGAGVEVIAAPLPYGAGPAACLHLMSLISLLDEATALVDLPWLAVETVELLRCKGYKFIAIDPGERHTLACNVLALGNKRLLAIRENAVTNQRLREHGFDVRTFPGSELCINGSGGPTCLTRPLLRG